MIPISSIRVTGRAASGVRLMKVEPGAKVIDAKLIEETEIADPLQAAPEPQAPLDDANSPLSL